MSAVLVPRIEARIQVIRGLRVMIDVDLAALYGVPTKALNQAVKRNAGRFPSDFLFRLTSAEKAEVVTNCDHLRKLTFSKVAVRELTTPPQPPKRPIGFLPLEDEKGKPRGAAARRAKKSR